MSRFASIAILFLSGCISGCYCSRIVSASDARDYGDSIRTRFRYRLVCTGNDGKDELMPKSQRLQMFQPDVFDDDGIPVALSVRDTLNTESWMGTLHLHRRGSISAAGQQHLASVEACSRDVFILGFLPPIPLLKCSWCGSPCFRSGHVFGSNSYGSYEDYIRAYYNPPSYDFCDMAMAYGIASRLKEAEDTGKINEGFAVKAIFAQSLADVASTMAKIRADDMARHGVAVKIAGVDGESPFEIVRCNHEHGRDFACTFTLRSRRSGALKLSDCGMIRTALRSAIRTHYLASHPDVNPRTLVIDFTKYQIEGSHIDGRVAVLTAMPESITYDSASRRGVLNVRVGDGQFEDARRWIRRNLAALANQSNIEFNGNAIPRGARFYSEGEEMREGVLKVSFRTE